MRELVKRTARLLGYELRRRPRTPPTDLLRFFDSPRSEFEAERDHGSRPNEVALSGQTPSPLPGIFSSSKKSLIVEGWRFLAQSYAVVNQWQLLALVRRNDVAVRVRDVAFFDRQWRPQSNLFGEDAERILRSLAIASPKESADVTLRMGFPLDFSTSRSRTTSVFGTIENQTLQPYQVLDSEIFRALEQKKRIPEVKVVTPSHWSAEGFYRAGYDPKQVSIVPHGIDVDVFHPAPDFRTETRRKLSIADDAFVFLSVGAMTSNKGIDLLLKAFAAVSRTFPHARLVLKGIDPLYQSRHLLIRHFNGIPGRDRRRILERMTYLGGSLPFGKLAALYQAADVYVSPYRAEGFNIPVLEAAASGLPVLCTKGGATDDFVLESFARRIEAKKRTWDQDGRMLSALEPSIEHLTASMLAAIEDSTWRTDAATFGPQHVAANYTWDRVVDRLISELWS